MNADSPEELLDVFRAAALSVTKLYKTSATAQAKARADGYQDCLEDILSFLDKGIPGLGDGDVPKIRRWATERLDGRDSAAPAVESDEEVDKAETASSPELHRATSLSSLSAAQNDTAMRTDSAPPPSVKPAAAEETAIAVPTLDTFNFQSHVPYPQEAYLEIANLDLSDSRPNDNNSSHVTTSSAPSITISRTARLRHGSNGTRSGPRSSGHMGRGAGQKRKLNLQEIFDLGSLGLGKEGKRSRHI